MRAYVDADNGVRQSVLDGVITHVPKQLDVCLRPKIDSPADVHDSSVWCEGQPADKTALQVKLTSPGAQRPDIDIATLRLVSGGGKSILDGNVHVRDMAPRLDVLAGSGKSTEVVAKALSLKGDTDEIGRLTFALRNFIAPPGGSAAFPFRSLDASSVEPVDDPRNRDDPAAPDAGINYMEVLTDPTSLSLSGSIPAIKTVSITPDRCEPGDERFPAPSDFDADHRPEYTCVNAAVGQGRPLGIAVRTLDTAGDALSIDDANLSQVPDGAGGLKATLTSSPDSVKSAPVCAHHADAGGA